MSAASIRPWNFATRATANTRWLGLDDKVSFQQGDATALVGDRGFDAAMTIHVAMNIAAKDAIYAGARRALKGGRIFAIVQGEGGAFSCALGTGARRR
jgi:ubiquinone/menaquinone biosynthesis C-methylase UbiE